jgi:hypothetical protein
MMKKNRGYTMCSSGGYAAKGTRPDNTADNTHRS